jgi:hypothetical protein
LAKLKFTVGVALTVIVKLCTVPEQTTLLFVNTGVTLICAITGLSPLLTALKAAMLPEPDAPSPMDVALLVQLYEVDDTVPEKAIAAVDDPLQTT